MSRVILHNLLEYCRNSIEFIYANYKRSEEQVIRRLTIFIGELDSWLFWVIHSTEDKQAKHIYTRLIINAFLLKYRIVSRLAELSTDSRDYDQRVMNDIRLMNNDIIEFSSRFFDSHQ